MLVQFSNLGGLGPSFRHLREKQPTRNNDHDKIEPARKKKARREKLDTEVDSPSSEGSWILPSVRALDLDEDILYLPNKFTKSNGIIRKYRKIVLIDGRETSWEMDLRFDEASDNFFITRGWRLFCREHGKTEGDFFIFHLAKKGDTFYLTCPKVSISDAAEKSRVRRQNRFVTRTLTKDSIKNCRLYMPLSFMRENGLNDPGMITLCGKNGMKTVADIKKESSGRMSIGRGWTEFAKANDLKTDETFTLELLWENDTPVLGLSSRCHNRFVTLSLTDDNFVNDRLDLPLPFVRENGLDKPGLITLLGRGGKEHLATLASASTGIMSLELGWKEFVIANSLNTGKSFTFEILWQNKTPLLNLCNPTSDKRHRGEFSKDSKKESVSSEPRSGNEARKAKNNGEWRRDSSLAIVNRFVTLTLKHDNARDCKLILPIEFMKANGIKRFGSITMLGQNGMNFYAFIPAKDGIIGVGLGWEGFCAANGVERGETFTLELISQQGTTDHVFRFRSSSDEYV